MGVNKLCTNYVNICYLYDKNNIVQYLPSIFSMAFNFFFSCWEIIEKLHISSSCIYVIVLGFFLLFLNGCHLFTHLLSGKWEEGQMIQERCFDLLYFTVPFLAINLRTRAVFIFVGVKKHVNGFHQPHIELLMDSWHPIKTLKMLCK